MHAILLVTLKTPSLISLKAGSEVQAIQAVNIPGDVHQYFITDATGIEFLVSAKELKFYSRKLNLSKNQLDVLRDTSFDRVIIADQDDTPIVYVGTHHKNLISWCVGDQIDDHTWIDGTRTIEFYACGQEYIPNTES